MKKIIIVCVIALMGTLNAYAQKYALINMDYILSQIPQYEMANEQLEQLSKRYEMEVEAMGLEAEQLMKQYQADVVYLTPEQQMARQEEILEKEKTINDYRAKYFGPEGELEQKRLSLVGRLNDEIYEAVKEIAEKNNFSMVLDRSSIDGLIFGSPKIDISKEVLQKLGY